MLLSQSETPKLAPKYKTTYFYKTSYEEEKWYW